MLPGVKYPGLTNTLPESVLATSQGGATEQGSHFELCIWLVTFFVRFVWACQLMSLVVAFHCLETLSASVRLDKGLSKHL